MRKEYDIAPTRKRLGINQPDLAAELDIDYRALAEIENGKVSITDDYHASIHAAIRRIESRKGNEGECEASSLVGSSPVT